MPESFRSTGLPWCGGEDPVHKAKDLMHNLASQPWDGRQGPLLVTADVVSALDEAIGPAGDPSLQSEDDPASGG